MCECAGPLDGRDVLLPASDRRRPETVIALERAGASVAEVNAYRTTEAPGAAAALRDLLAHDPPDMAAFTSPSAVEVFARVVAEPPPLPVPRLAAIGRTTAEALAAHGWSEPVRPESPGLESLAEALAHALASAR